jgi:glycosyltransferase involved in cell wall biosynthesis
MKKPLIIIPAFNEEQNIERVVDNLIENYSQYDYVIINDGSYDDTRKICKKRGYNILDLPVNLGLSGAIRGGMKYANYYGYDYVIQYDGDGQHQAEYIELMLDAMKKYNVDIVIGSRFVSERKPLNIRMIGSQLITYAIFVTTKGKYIGDVTSGMRLFNKRMIKKFGYHINYSPEPDTLAYLVNNGIKIKEIQVHMIDRVAGKSYLSLGRSIHYMLYMFFSIFIFQWFRNRLEEK